MRRTCPIVIPDQYQQKDSIHHRPKSALQTTTPNHYPKDFDIDSNFMTETDIDADNENNANYCFNDSNSEVATTSNGYFFTDTNNENNQMPSTSNISNDDVIHSNVNEYERANDMAELNSLNNEFLNTILISQQNIIHDNVPSSSMQSNHLIDSNYVVNLDDDMAATATAAPPYSDDTRPRQLGRRSEMRSRIVSITAERSAEGNQVSLY